SEARYDHTRSGPSPPTHSHSLVTRRPTLMATLMQSRVAAPGDTTPSTVQTVDCCVVGGGPAGMVLALLLGRQGVQVMLLEAHDTFNRKFRGDSVHPSTLELIDQLGLLDRLMQLPHARVADFPVHYPDGTITPPTRPNIPTRFRETLQVPQVD